LLSRRRFLEEATLLTGSAVLANSALASVHASMQDPLVPDPKLLERARTLLEMAPLIDTHNDLPTMFLETKAGDLTSFDMGIVQPTLCADIPRLREGRVGVQYWSIWVESATQKTHTSLHEALREFDVAQRFVNSRPELEQARTADDIDRIHKSGRIACLFGVEGGHMIENSPAALRTFYQLGARYMTLTHWDNIDWDDAATDRPEH
jgi:membrane dipeptidase